MKDIKKIEEKKVKLRVVRGNYWMVHKKIDETKTSLIHQG